MEESSAWHEEERTATLYAYHPCHFLQQALRALLRCLGIESGTSMSSSSHPKLERTSFPQTHAPPDPTLNSPTNTQTSIDAADPSSVTDHRAINTSSWRDGSRRSPISHGPGPQHN